MSKKNKQIRGLFRKLNSIYARLPQVECKLMCAHSCGPIGAAVAPIELDRIRKKTSLNFVFPMLGCEQCPLLTSQGLCAIHDIRPFICRLWGVAKDRLMKCPHGCAGHKISNSDARELWNLVLELSNAYDITLDLLGENNETLASQ